MVRVAILQSSYIPWKGYFDIIGAVDHFVIYDEVQFTRRDWRNRNRIKTRNGSAWLTIPVVSKGRYYQSISEVEVADDHWADQHWQTIRHNYAGAEYFRPNEAQFREAYRRAGRMRRLSEINRMDIDIIAEYLDLRTSIVCSSSLAPRGPDASPTSRLLEICLELGASRYVSGPSAKAYLDETVFSDAGVEVEYFDYSNYPVYTQLHGPFDHRVSILDLIFNTGPKARENMLLGRVGK